MTDIPAGEGQAEITFTEKTVNYLVDKRLRELAERAREYYVPAPEGF